MNEVGASFTDVPAIHEIPVLRRTQGSRFMKGAFHVRVREYPESDTGSNSWHVSCARRVGNDSGSTPAKAAFARFFQEPAAPGHGICAQATRA
ncbi:Uncharacterised protein [Mycobacteroides abscessus subsp. abscessus]|nr:Uncharacterised protein [Mycobacteroides abscessus subsp. abscessus]